MALTEKKCKPCDGGIPPLDSGAEDRLLGEVPGWTVDRENIHKIRRVFTLENFTAAMRFVNAVAEIAEREQHHPDIHISYKRVTIELHTHAIPGLSENDFIVAAKINNIVT